MPFTDSEVETIQSIFFRLAPGTPGSMQSYNEKSQNRTGYTFVIRNKWKKPICIFQIFNNLTPYRLKLLDKLKKKVSHEIHFTDLKNGFTMVGWKCL